jgi:hypothetical protein
MPLAATLTLNAESVSCSDEQPEGGGQRLQLKLSGPLTLEMKSQRK